LKKQLGYMFADNTKTVDVGSNYQQRQYFKQEVPSHQEAEFFQTSIHKHMRELQKAQYLFLEDAQIDILEFTQDELKNQSLMLVKEQKFMREIDLKFCKPITVNKILK
jgi:hypothetical protein